MNTCLPELVDLGNGLAAHGDSLGADICRRTITEIERLEAVVAKLQDLIDQYAKAYKAFCKTESNADMDRLDAAGQLLLKSAKKLKP